MKNRICKAFAVFLVGAAISPAVFGHFGISMPFERDLVVLADSDWFNRFDLYLMNLREGGVNQADERQGERYVSLSHP